MIRLPLAIAQKFQLATIKHNLLLFHTLPEICKVCDGLRSEMVWIATQLLELSQRFGLQMLLLNY